MRGLAKDGKPAELITLTNQCGLRVTLMDVGATWLSCQVPVEGTRREILLNVSNLDDYYKQSAYFGATVGRYANRIHEGRFVIDGKEYQLTTNHFNNTLHGGVDGLDKRRWKIDEVTAKSVIFSIVSSDGDQGFPGELSVKCIYTLHDSGLDIEYQAISTAKTPVNLTNHAYFNLLGDKPSAPILGHKLYINSDLYLPTDAEGIPKQALKSVKGSSFDFTELKTIESSFLAEPDQAVVGGYDHSFLLKETSDGDAQVKLVAPDESITLSIHTTQPAIQLYTGNFLQGEPDRYGTHYSVNDALCLEPQMLPDSPNRSDWPHPSVFLVPNTEYYQKSRYLIAF